MGYRKWCWIIRGIGILGGIILFFGVIQGTHTVYIGIGGAILLLALIIAVCALRCPKCGERVPERLNMKIAHCPHCGEKLS